MRHASMNTTCLLVHTICRICLDASRPATKKTALDVGSFLMLRQTHLPDAHMLDCMYTPAALHSPGPEYVAGSHWVYLVQVSSLEEYMQFMH
mmetsp:Transcript_51033/g.93297  ORF Transcript_51033/g.93297 Transcript_51033/m.93297 type:complete len:92 (-) Transcript_51033:822-1097(-)